MTSPDPQLHEGDASSRFVTTRWTRVLAARGPSPEARQALSDLCEAYYAPVVSFLRRDGRGEDEAREIAHDFFARILQGPAFDRADPARGRFRSYLLGAIKHHLAARRERASREKRGGGLHREPFGPGLDTGADDPGFPATWPVPDAAFDRAWALHLIQRALEIVERECLTAVSRREYEVLKPWLGSEVGRLDVAGAAGVLGMSEGAVRVAIHRLRRRFREVVTAEIAQTVEGPQEVAAELHHLIAALSQ